MLSNVSELHAVHTALEMMFPLPVEIGRETPAIVLHCHARIVRTILPPASDQLDSIAANFLDYRLRRHEPKTAGDSK